MNSSGIVRKSARSRASRARRALLAISTDVAVLAPISLRAQTLDETLRPLYAIYDSTSTPPHVRRFVGRTIHQLSRSAPLGATTASDAISARLGGEVRRTDATSVDLPPGALAQDLVVTISSAIFRGDADEVAKRTDMTRRGLQPAANAVEFGPDGTAFSAPVKISWCSGSLARISVGKVAVFVFSTIQFRKGSSHDWKQMLVGALDLHPLLGEPWPQLASEPEHQEVSGQEIISAALTSNPSVSTSAVINIAVVDDQGFGLADISTLPTASFANLTGSSGATTYKACDGASLEHPSNHWTSGDTLARALSAIIEFHNETGINLGINDMSLSSGGMFDICSDWQRVPVVNLLGQVTVKGHLFHRGGNSIDIDKGSLTTKQIKLLTDRMAKHGGQRVVEGPIHYQFPGPETCFGTGGQ